MYRKAVPEDLERCMEIRGKTRDNPIPRHILEEIGVTETSWQMKMEKGRYIGTVAEFHHTLIGFCFGDVSTGEVLVLAVLSGYDGQGVGKELLYEVMGQLRQVGHEKLWLAAAPDPKMRAYGFYRHLGWKSTGIYDDQGDELLEFHYS